MLALGCYLCVNDVMFDRESDSIFRKSGKDKSASDTYCKALNELLLDLNANRCLIAVLVERLAPQYIVCACEEDDSIKPHHRGNFIGSGGFEVVRIPSGLCTAKKQLIIIRDGHFIHLIPILH